MDRSGSRSYAAVLQAGLTTAVIVAGILYSAVALGARDALWFWPTFDRQPTVIAVRCGGREVFLEPGQSSYTEFVGEFNRLLSGLKRWDELSWSPATEAEYAERADWVVTRLTYSPPVRIHSQYPYFSNTSTLIVPLVGRHAEAAPVFGKVGNLSDPGSLHLPSNERLLEILVEHEVCSIG